MPWLSRFSEKKRNKTKTKTHEQQCKCCGQSSHQMLKYVVTQMINICDLQLSNLIFTMLCIKKHLTQSFQEFLICALQVVCVVDQRHCFIGCGIALLCLQIPPSFCFSPEKSLPVLPSWRQGPLHRNSISQWRTTGNPWFDLLSHCNREKKRNHSVEVLSFYQPFLLLLYHTSLGLPVLVSPLFFV